MAQAKITKRTVDAAKKGAKDAFIWDSDLRGFGLKVTPAGRKVYILQLPVPRPPAPVHHRAAERRADARAGAHSRRAASCPSGGRD